MELVRLRCAGGTSAVKGQKLNTPPASQVTFAVVATFLDHMRPTQAQRLDTQLLNISSVRTPGQFFLLIYSLSRILCRAAVGMCGSTGSRHSGRCAEALRLRPWDDTDPAHVVQRIPFSNDAHHRKLKWLA